MRSIEEIRKGIDHILLRAALEMGVPLDRVKERLSDLGVVIKVERDLPDGLYLSGDFRHPNLITKAEVEAIMDLATEPLIEEK